MGKGGLLARRRRLDRGKPWKRRLLGRINRGQASPFVLDGAGEGEGQTGLHGVPEKKASGRQTKFGRALFPDSRLLPVCPFSPPLLPPSPIRPSSSGQSTGRSLLGSSQHPAGPRAIAHAVAALSILIAAGPRSYFTPPPSAPLCHPRPHPPLPTESMRGIAGCGGPGPGQALNEPPPRR